MKKKNTWDIIKIYINKLKIGTIITRAQLLTHVLGKAEYLSKKSRITTIDNYRMALTHCGILETVKHGHYEVKAHIKEDVSAQLLRKTASSKNWRNWFIQIKKLEESSIARGLNL
jgi:hypothetical protein